MCLLMPKRNTITQVNIMFKNLCASIASIFCCCKPKKRNTEIIHLTHIQSKYPDIIEPCYKNPRPVSAFSAGKQSPQNIPTKNDTNPFTTYEMVTINDVISDNDTTINKQTKESIEGHTYYEPNVNNETDYDIDKFINEIFDFDETNIDETNIDISDNEKKLKIDIDMDNDYSVINKQPNTNPFSDNISFY